MNKKMILMLYFSFIYLWIGLFFTLSSNAGTLNLEQLSSNKEKKLHLILTKDVFIKSLQALKQHGNNKLCDFFIGNVDSNFCNYKYQEGILIDWNYLIYEVLRNDYNAPYESVTPKYIDYSFVKEGGVYSIDNKEVKLLLDAIGDLNNLYYCNNKDIIDEYLGWFCTTCTKYDIKFRKDSFQNTYNEIKLKPYLNTFINDYNKLLAIFIDEIAKKAQRDKKNRKIAALKEDMRTSQLIKEIQSGKIKPRNYKEYIIYYKAKNAFNILTNPPLKPTNGVFYLSGILNDIKNNMLLCKYNNYYFYIINWNKFKQNIKINDSIRIIGKHIQTIKEYSVIGTSIWVPVFRAIYME